MKFRGIDKKSEGKFITRYDIQYETEDGQPKTYEMISRNKDIKTYEELNGLWLLGLQFPGWTY